MDKLATVESDLLEQLNLDIPNQVLDKFQTLIRESSSKDEKEAFKFLGSLLDKAGVPHTIRNPKIYLSVPISASVEVNGKTYRAKTPAFSKSTDGLTGELIYIPAGTKSDKMDIFAVEVLNNEESFEGKVVVSEGLGLPARVKYFEDRGALASIFINPGKNIHDGICTPIWGSPDLDNYETEPEAFSIAVNYEDGQELIKLAQESNTHATLKTKLKKGWFECPLLDICIEGNEEPEKFVLLHGHLDSWTYGLGDNATGDAALVEMARVLYHNRKHLKRSVRVAIWPGHSTGRYAGSTWFADYFGLDLEENCVAQVNCDSPGCRWATSYEFMDWTEEVDGHCQTVIRDALNKPSKGSRPTRAGDYSFNNIGISSYFMLSSTMPTEVAAEKGYYPVGGCGGNIVWHTEDDLIDVVDTDILLKDMKMYLLAVIRNVNATILPYDFTKSVESQLKVLAEYEDAVKGVFTFESVKKDGEKLLTVIQEFNEKLEPLKQNGSLQDQQVKHANDLLLELGRELIRINYSRAGKFRHDPALNIPPLPDLAPATELHDHEEGSHLYLVTLNHLLRGSNRVSSTYRKLIKELSNF
ncbi:M28 family peptidase [Paenisporosarcina sp. TG20]|uniref:M28 family peptidase n=1 Tax=Paenisporosarcina sp. TG20 TaxID=1211706 RepID=UPI00030C20CC|nr:M28 family peptidase [Paenisporosarcina sp. TG20]